MSDEETNSQATIYQKVVIVIAFLMIFSTCYQFYRLEKMNSDLENHQQELHDKQETLKMLEEIEVNYEDAYLKLLEADIRVFHELEMGTINKAKADLEIEIAAVGMVKPFHEFSKEVLRTGSDEKQKLEVLNEYAWLFPVHGTYDHCELVFDEVAEKLQMKEVVHNLAYVHFTFLKPHQDDKVSGYVDTGNWSITTLDPDKFLHKGTHEIVQRVIPGIPLNIEVSQKLYHQTLNDLSFKVTSIEGNMKGLNLSIAGTTVALLILGFIADFAHAGRIWKSIFITITVIMACIALFSEILFAAIH